MYFLSYYCVQVLVLLVCQLEFSYSVPIRPPSHFDLLIDPLHQSELEDLESKKIVPKSVLNVPYITPIQTVPSCPPGQTRLSGGPCVQRVVSSGLSDDQSLVAQLTKQYFNKRKQQPPKRRHPTTRTTTQEPVPTTEVVTESTVSSKDLAATTTVWSTTKPTLTSTPKSQQEQAFTGKENSSYSSSSVETDRDHNNNNDIQEILTSTLPTVPTVADKDVTTEQAVVEQTSLLNDLSIGTPVVLAEDQTSQTTETYSINDKTTLNYGIDATEFPSQMPDESTFTPTELPLMETPRETTQYEESYEPITELPKEKEESEKELMEIPRTTTTTNRNETEGIITEQSTVLPAALTSLNQSSDADVISSENSNPTEKVNPAVETSSPFTTTEAPQKSETVRVETTSELISVEDGSSSSSRTPVAPVVEQVEEFTTAIYMSEPARIPPLPYEPDMIFDFVPSPSDIYKPTMPPKYTPAPKASLPLEISSSRSGRLDDISQTRRSSFISYDYFVGPQGLPRSNNFNPAYTFS